MKETGKKTILVADDDPEIRETLRQMLSKDYTVLEAADGEEAMNVAHSQHLDVILLDVVMPKIDGYAVCHEIKKDPTTKAICVVILSALGQELNRVLSAKLGAEEHISKPVAMQDLLDTVSRCLPASLCICRRSNRK
jgi:two-component system phosphate regulon response regulator PhoB